MIINLTPHAVTILGEDGSVVAEFASAGVARAKQTDVPAGDVDGIPTVRSTFGAPEGLPEHAAGVFYVVSAITANAATAAGRTTTDLLVTSGPVRDGEGRIIGCRALARI
jgi:hypothetical protein